MSRRKSRKSATISRGARPTGISIISILEAIAALFLFLGATAFSSIPFYGMRGIISAIAGLGAIVLLISGVLLLFSAIGLWYGSRWGWWLELVLSGILILSITVIDVLGFVIGLVLIYYITRPNVKKWFRVS